MTENMVSLLRLSSVSEIYDILITFKDVFPRSLDRRVGNLVEYANKLLQNAKVFVAKKNDCSVGFIAYYVNRPETKFSYLTLIAVHTDYQRQGIARRLVEYYEDDARNNNFLYSKLEVDANNISAINLYKNMGYTTSDAASINTVYMIKSLSVKDTTLEPDSSVINTIW